MKRGPNKHQHILKNMLRYKTKTRPGLVALYDMRPGNGAGPFFFLQPGARTGPTVMKGSWQDYKLEQHQNLVFMCHITEQHDYCHLGMFSTCENRFYSRLLQLFVHG